MVIFHLFSEGAENVLKEESSRLGLPYGMPTFSDIEALRLAAPTQSEEALPSE